MKILITGGAGYLGSTMVPYFLSQGHSVTVLDNFFYRQNSLLECCKNKKFEIIRGDCRDERLIKPAISGVDVIIPLAALVGAPLCESDKIAAATVNRDAVININKLCSSNQMFLLPVTNSGYGIGEPGKFCTEDTPLSPISHYGKTKVEAEKEVLRAGNAISFRLATVFGVSPRMRLDLLVNDFAYRAVNDNAIVLFEANFKRNYIHVCDVARVFLHGIKNYGDMRGRPYNVGLSDANLSKLELCEKIKKHLPKFVFMESQIGEDPDKRDYIVSMKE
jgi:nucleoside-diphosphate-sugar epimerase